MNSTQRKIHLISWIAIALAGSLFLFFTIKNLHFNAKKITETQKPLSRPFLKTNNNDLIELFLYASKIEIIVKSSLKTPSAVVYTIDKNEKKGDLLGQVSAAGSYVFPTQNPVFGVLIFDPIKEETITKLSF